MAALEQATVCLGELGLSSWAAIRPLDLGRTREGSHVQPQTAKPPDLGWLLESVPSEPLDFFWEQEQRQNAIRG